MCCAGLGGAEEQLPLGDGGFWLLCGSGQSVGLALVLLCALGVDEVTHQGSCLYCGSGAACIYTSTCLLHGMYLSPRHWLYLFQFAFYMLVEN